MGRFRRKLHPEFLVHVTGRCNNREEFPVPIDESWEIFSDFLHLLSGWFGIRIHQFVLMPNHFHLICRDPCLKLPDGMRMFMAETSKELSRKSGRINRIWGRPYHTTLIQSSLHSLFAYKYVYRNPVAAGICQSVEEYPWSSLSVLLGRVSGSFPIEEDVQLFQQTEEVLRWLNTRYSSRDSHSIRMSFRKAVFALPMDPNSRKPVTLDEFEAISNAKNPGMLGGTL